MVACPSPYTCCNSKLLFAPRGFIFCLPPSRPSRNESNLVFALREQPWGTVSNLHWTVCSVHQFPLIAAPQISLQFLPRLVSPLDKVPTARVFPAIHCILTAFSAGPPPPLQRQEASATIGLCFLASYSAMCLCNSARSGARHGGQLRIQESAQLL